MGWTKEIKKTGTGGTPTKGQTITVHCTGFIQSTGAKFWSTKDPGQTTFSFKVGMGKVIRGWDEGFMAMKLGEQARLTITGDYAYGATGFPAWGIGPNATLLFDVEIISIA